MKTYGVAVPIVKPIGFGGVAAIYNGEVMGGITQTKKTGRSCGIGGMRIGFGYLGDARLFQGIYQKRVTGYNNRGRIPGRVRRTYYMRLRSYRPSNPRTEVQQANRQKMADACEAWKNLTVDDIATYTRRGKKCNRVPRMIFISEYLKSHRS